MFLRLVIELLIFGVGAAVAWAVIQGVNDMLVVRRRLGVEGGASGTLQQESVLRSSTVDNRFLKWVQTRSSLSNPISRNKLKRELTLAGIEHPAAPIWYVMGRVLLAIGLPLAVLFILQTNGRPLTGLSLILVPLAVCGFALIIPRAILDNRVRARMEQTENEFPDVLDLTVVCVEAGLGIESAFVRVGEEVRESHPRMAEAYARVSQELRAGRTRADALRSMADRTNVDGIRSFAALLIQTDSLGTSVAQTLRTYAVEMRSNRFLKAEEKAMRIPVLMTIPLITCILPVIIGALLLPPGIDIARELLPTLRGS